MNFKDIFAALVNDTLWEIKKPNFPQSIVKENESESTIEELE